MIFRDFYTTWERIVGLNTLYNYEECNKNCIAMVIREKGYQI